MFFNELSIEGDENIRREAVLAFVKVYRTLLKYEITTCRISSEDNHRLHQMIQSMPDFSKRLCECPYVEGIVNSLPFNSHERKFIRRVREGGLIEIVLPWTDKGYGIVVKTTGRTIRETEMIGRIIEEKYGRV